MYKTLVKPDLGIMSSTRYLGISISHVLFFLPNVSSYARFFVLTSVNSTWFPSTVIMYLYANPASSAPDGVLMSHEAFITSLGGMS